MKRKMVKEHSFISVLELLKAVSFIFERRRIGSHEGGSHLLNIEVTDELKMAQII